MQVDIPHLQLQLTLKYTQLEDKERKHQRHLQRLLAPHHIQLGANYYTITRGIEARISIYPKVINGKYLLLSIWTSLP